MAKTDRILANDYHDFFIRGESFFYAVKTLFNQSPKAQAAAAFAIGANGAFATEVYLKVLAHLEHGLGHLNTHSLPQLFDDLSPNLRTAFEASWYLAQKSMEWTDENGVPATEEDDIPSPATLHEALQLSADAFVEFRYDIGETSFAVGSLTNMLRAAIFEKKPDWKPELRSPYSTINPHPHLVKRKLEASARFARFTVFNHKAATF